MIGKIGVAAATVVAVSAVETSAEGVSPFDNAIAENNMVLA